MLWRLGTGRLAAVRVRMFDRIGCMYAKVE